MSAGSSDSPVKVRPIQALASTDPSRNFFNTFKRAEASADKGAQEHDAATVASLFGIARLRAGDGRIHHP